MYASCAAVFRHPCHQSLPGIRLGLVTALVNNVQNETSGAKPVVAVVSQRTVLVVDAHILLRKVHVVPTSRSKDYIELC